PFSVLRSSASTDICSLSLHDALPIWGSKTLRQSDADVVTVVAAGVTVFEALKAYETLARDGIAIRVIDAYSIQPIDKAGLVAARSEEHTSELQSRENLVCRLLLEKKK